MKTKPLFLVLFAVTALCALLFNFPDAVMGAVPSALQLVASAVFTVLWLWLAVCSRSRRLDVLLLVCAGGCVTAAVFGSVISAFNLAVDSVLIYLLIAVFLFPFYGLRLLIPHSWLLLYAVCAAMGAAVVLLTLRRLLQNPGSFRLPGWKFTES